ncbi:MAG: hypothetical protein ACOCWQ_03480 [Nanoarchaeota archaeon]
MRNSQCEFFQSPGKSIFQAQNDWTLVKQVPVTDASVFYNITCASTREIMLDRNTNVKSIALEYVVRES